jgi:hypothetical protein
MANIKHGGAELCGCAEEIKLGPKSCNEMIVGEEDGVPVEVGSVHISITIDCW